LTAAILVILLHNVAGTRLAHVRHVFRYPPLPIAVLVGILLIAVRDAALNKQPDWKSYRGS
jgi:hypothetical protein